MNVNYDRRKYEIEIEYHKNEIKRHELEIDILESELSNLD